MDAWPIDGDLAAYRSVPASARAVVLLLHGYGEHTGRHRATLEALARSGIAVYGYDARGHGNSPGRRAFVERFSDLVDESLAMRARVAREHPNLPLFLLGVSMGGVVAVRSAQRDPGGLCGVVLVAPALAFSPPPSPVTLALGKLLATLAPTVPVARLDLAALSRNTQVAADYAADPLTCHGGVPARTAVEVLGAGAAALHAAGAWKLPALIVHGAADRIAAPAGSHAFTALAGPANDVTLRLVNGGFHEPFSEAGGDALVAEVANWLLARSDRVAAGSVAVPPAPSPPSAPYTWVHGLAFGAAVNVLARLLGTNSGRYEAIERPWFAPPGWVFPVVWGLNSWLTIWGNLRVLNGPASADRTAYLRLWSATWLLYIAFGYVFFRRRSPLLGYLVTINYLALAVLSAGRAVRIERQLWRSYATLLPWLVLATAVATAVAQSNPDPLLDPDAPRAER